MALVTTKGMLVTANEENFAIGAFNANNLEMAKGIVEAATEMNSPVIVEVSHGGILHGGVKEMAACVKALARQVEIPVALHYDHGTDLIHNIKCLRAGFTSLMFDGSDLSYIENVKKTKLIVNIAHSVGVPVEGELGKIPENQDEIAPEKLMNYLTDPQQAKDFVDKTGVDFLAVAVGSMHKMKSQSVNLDIDRIKRIKKYVKLPLVLHGSSGVTDRSIKEAIESGISKINVHTYLAKNFTLKVRKVLKDNPEMVDLRKYLKPGREALKEAVKEQIDLFGSFNKADRIKHRKVEEPSGFKAGRVVE